jgi:hypothetical protein
VIELLSVSIHDPDVVFTDLGLAILGAYLGRRLWTQPGQGVVPRAGAVLMGGLASAALWGAIFHGVFPTGTATRSGLLVWIPVVLSIVVAATAMLYLGLRILIPQLPPGIRRLIIATYAAAFAAVALLAHESFTSIVYFYVPALSFLLIAAARQAIQSRDAGWILVTTGLVLSAAAAILQQAKVAIHPIHFDHNAVYHVVQAIAVVVLYLGWRRAAEPELTTLRR